MSTISNNVQDTKEVILGDLKAIKNRVNNDAELNDTKHLISKANSKEINNLGLMFNKRINELLIAQLYLDGSEVLPL